jgi:hypothetical protein
MDMIETAALLSAGHDIDIRLPPVDDIVRDWPQIEPILKRARRRYVADDLDRADQGQRDDTSCQQHIY